MDSRDTNNLPKTLYLLTGRKYMIWTNLDVVDKIANGIVGKLHFIEYDTTNSNDIERL